MRVKTIRDEDFANYKKPSMFIGIGHCNWKCCKESHIPITECQNSELAKISETEISCKDIYERYISNPITSAIVIGGLEPFTRSSDVIHLIDYIRNQKCQDDIVIYTGYYPSEIPYEIIYLKERYDNIIIKYGRYIPNRNSRFDNILGVSLISDNQYAERI